MILKMIGIKLTFKETKKWINHLRGKVGAEEAEYVPKDEYHKMLLPLGFGFLFILHLLVWPSSIRLPSLYFM